MPTFDATDFDNAVSESGTAHESVTNTDHTDASQLKQGYDIQNPYLSADLVGYWPLQEDSGSTAYDFSGNNNDGTINGATVNVEGLLGTSAYSFDGTDDYIILGDHAAFEQNSLTCTYWYNSGGYSPSNKADGMGSKGYSLGDGGLEPWYLFYYEPSGVIETYLRDSNANEYVATSTTSIDDGNWHFVAHVIDAPNGDAFVYVDGSQEGSVSGVPDIVWGQNGGDFVLMDHSQRYTRGDLTQVHFFNRALSTSKIQTLYDVVATKGDLTTQFKSV